MKLYFNKIYKKYNKKLLLNIYTIKTNNYLKNLILLLNIINKLLLYKKTILKV